MPVFHIRILRHSSLSLSTIGYLDHSLSHLGLQRTETHYDGFSIAEAVYEGFSARDESAIRTILAREDIEGWTLSAEQIAA